MESLLQTNHKHNFTWVWAVHWSGLHPRPSSEYESLTPCRPVWCLHTVYICFLTNNIQVDHNGSQYGRVVTVKKNHNRQRKISSHSDWFLCCATSFPLKLYCKITAAVLCGGKKKLLTSPFKPSGDWCLKKVGVLHNVLLNRQWYTKQKAAGWKISDIVAF